MADKHTETFEIAIIGLGPVGATLANLLMLLNLILDTVLELNLNVVKKTVGVLLQMDGKEHFGGVVLVKVILMKMSSFIWKEKLALIV